jgi:hypothetical protein
MNADYPAEFLLFTGHGNCADIQFFPRLQGKRSPFRAAVSTRNHWKYGFFPHTPPH